MKEEDLLGLTLHAARQIANVRPTKIDGEYMIATMDFRPERINVEIKDGVIVAILGHG